MNSEAASGDVSSTELIWREDPLRVVFVGDYMDLAMSAFTPGHQARHHIFHFCPNLEDVKHRRLKPDVVVVSSLVEKDGEILGACALHGIVSPDTLIVVLIQGTDPANAMFVKHARMGGCHPRMLLHYPDPAIDDVVKYIDQAARQEGSGKQITTTGHIPASMMLYDIQKDIGRLLYEDVQEGRGNFARILLAASADPDWSNWTELAGIVCLAVGTVKNVKRQMAKKLSAAGYPMRGGNDTWTVQDFVRFATELRPFVRVFCRYHLGMVRPLDTSNVHPLPLVETDDGDDPKLVVRRNGRRS